MSKSRTSRPSGWLPTKSSTWRPVRSSQPVRQHHAGAGHGPRRWRNHARAPVRRCRAPVLTQANFAGTLATFDGAASLYRDHRPAGRLRCPPPPETPSTASPPRWRDCSECPSRSGQTPLFSAIASAAASRSFHETNQLDVRHHGQVSLAVLGNWTNEKREQASPVFRATLIRSRVV